MKAVVSMKRNASMTLTITDEELKELALLLGSRMLELYRKGRGPKSPEGKATKSIAPEMRLIKSLNNKLTHK